MQNVYYLPTKITKNEFINDFLDGMMYMNSIIYFRNLENPSQGDYFEGKHIANHRNMGLPHDLEKVVKDFWYENNDNIPFFKLLCLYGWRVDCEHSIEKPSELLITEFGDTAIIIKDYMEFKDRFKRAMDKKYNSDYYADDQPIKYSPQSYNVTLADHLFTKREKYTWQNEIRIGISIKNCEDKKPFIVNIGNIRDITTVMPTVDFVACKNIDIITNDGNYVLVQWDEDDLENRN